MKYSAKTNNAWSQLKYGIIKTGISLQLLTVLTNLNILINFKNTHTPKFLSVSDKF